MRVTSDIIDHLQNLCTDGYREGVRGFISESGKNDAINIFISPHDNSCVMIKMYDMYTMAIFESASSPEEYYLIVNDATIVILDRTAKLIEEHFGITSAAVDYANYYFVSEGVKIPVKRLIQDINITSKALYSATHSHATSMNTKDLNEILSLEGTVSIEDVNQEILLTGDLFE